MVEPEYNLPFKRNSAILELGGGDKPLFRPNADSRYLPTVDIVCDFSNPLPIPSQSYDGIYSRFVIEHLSWRKVKVFISECYRVLKPGGIAVIIAPNLLEQARKLIDSEHWNEDLICMIFGDQNYPYFWDANSHHCGFSPEYAKRIFKAAGFYKTEVYPLPQCNTDMIVEAHKSRANIG